MESNNNKIQVVIASTQFLYRLGVKTMLSIVDIDPDIIEVDTIEELQSFHRNYPGHHFVIIGDDLLSYPKHDCIDNLLKSECKLMVIGDDERCNCQGVARITNSDSQKEILDKFQEFFFEQKSNDNGADSSLLSEREIDVLKAVALGLSNKEIAEKLFISINTVVTHRKNVTEKLGIKTIAGLTVYALMNNFISPEDVQK